MTSSIKFSHATEASVHEWRQTSDVIPLEQILLPVLLAAAEAAATASVI